ncbi:MAG: Nif3-like dinuclear metal center hexameric protein, partial [Bacteroidota bacterium]|nr:Nif3-like dinuclear metal center hexameric protein [Bacteroidota bacterium]
GHYESEQFTKDLIFEFLNKNLVNIALHLSNENTNPIKYF